jgi:hypothetical protein
MRILMRAICRKKKDELARASKSENQYGRAALVELLSRAPNSDKNSDEVDDADA